MSLLFFDGFEGGSQVVKPEWLTAPPISSTTGVRTGIFAIRPLNNALALPTPAATLYMGASAFLTATASDCVGTFRSGGVNHISVRIADSTRLIEIRRGTHTGTVLATSTYAYPLSVARFVQIKLIISDVGGECTVQVDGTTVVTFSGNTTNGGSGALSVDQITFSPGNNNIYIDDLWICDGVDATATQGRPNNTYLGDLRVSSILPNANGASSQFLGSDGNSTDNYLLVDETTPNTTDYVGTSTAGQQDFYGMQDLATNTVSIYGVRAGGYVAKSDAGAAGIRIGIRESGGTVTLNSSYALSTTWTGAHTTQHFVKPSDSAVWTVADVNGLQAGIESAAS